MFVAHNSNVVTILPTAVLLCSAMLNCRIATAFFCNCNCQRHCRDIFPWFHLLDKTCLSTLCVALIRFVDNARTQHNRFSQHGHTFHLLICSFLAIFSLAKVMLTFKSLSAAIYFRDEDTPANLDLWLLVASSTEIYKMASHIQSCARSVTYGMCGGNAASSTSLAGSDAMPKIYSMWTPCWKACVLFAARRHVRVAKDELIV